MSIGRILLLSMYSIPFIAVLLFTVGYGIYLRSQKEQGFLGVLLLSFLNLVVFTYMILFRT